MDHHFRTAAPSQHRPSIIPRDPAPRDSVRIAFSTAPASPPHHSPARVEVMDMDMDHLVARTRDLVPGSVRRRLTQHHDSRLRFSACRVAFSTGLSRTLRKLPVQVSRSLRSVKAAFLETNERHPRRALGRKSRVVDSQLSGKAASLRDLLDHSRRLDRADSLQGRTSSLSASRPDFQRHWDIRGIDDRSEWNRLMAMNGDFTHTLAAIEDREAGRQA